jgi:hypothetical protein
VIVNFKRLRDRHHHFAIRKTELVFVVSVRQLSSQALHHHLFDFLNGVFLKSLKDSFNLLCRKDTRV